MEILLILGLIGAVIFLFAKNQETAQRHSAPPPNVPTSIYGAPLRSVSTTRSRDGSAFYDSVSAEYDTVNRISPYELAAYKMIEAGFVPAQLPPPEMWMESLAASQYPQYSQHQGYPHQQYQQRPPPRTYGRPPAALPPYDPYRSGY